MGVIGLIWIVAPSIPWLGRLPGDIRIETGHDEITLADLVGAT
jgi:hypothetical protein